MPPVKALLSGPITAGRLFGLNLRLEDARVSVSGCEGIFLEHPLKKKKKIEKKGSDITFQSRAPRDGRGEREG